MIYSLFRLSFLIFFSLSQKVIIIFYATSKVGKLCRRSQRCVITDYLLVRPFVFVFYLRTDILSSD